MTKVVQSRSAIAKGWDEMLKANMALTDDFDTNMFMAGWAWGAGIQNKRKADMPKAFQDGFDAGRGAVLETFDARCKQKGLIKIHRPPAMKAP